MQSISFLGHKVPTSGYQMQSLVFHEIACEGHKMTSKRSNPSFILCSLPLFSPQRFSRGMIKSESRNIGSEPIGNLIERFYEVKFSIRMHVETLMGDLCNWFLPTNYQLASGQGNQNDSNICTVFSATSVLRSRFSFSLEAK